MSLPRQALALSIVYAFVLLVWLVAGLEFIDWNEHNLRLLFRQTLAALLLLQLLATALLFINAPAGRWRESAQAILHIVLFPLPLLALVWLTGGASVTDILKGLLLVGSVGLLALLVQQSIRPVSGTSDLIDTARALAHVLLAVMVWNFRELWWGWLEL